MLIKPNFRFRSVNDITPEFLASKGIKGLILDLDNTLTLHDSNEPQPGVMNWLDTMRENNIKLMIVSNNTPQRVEPTANKFSLSFVANGKKPLPSGYTKARQIMNLSKKQVAAVGDQIFTDMIGGNLSGMYTILVEPFEDEKKGFLHFKRVIQKKLFPPRFEDEKTV